MGKYCKTCKKAVNANEKSYICVACSCNMHLTPECTVLSPAAITVIKELGMKAMLFCKNCVEQNERDIFNRYRNMSKVAENRWLGRWKKTEEYGKAANGFSR